MTVAALRGADRLGKGIRGAPRDAILADATPSAQRGQIYGLNRAMDYAGAVIGTLLAAAALSWMGLGLTQVIALSALPGIVVLILLMLLPVPANIKAAQSSAPTALQPLSWSSVSPPLQHYLQVLALLCFAKASEAFIILRGHELGMQTVTLLLLWAWLVALQTLTAYLGAPLADRMAKHSLTLFNWISLAVGYAGLAMADTETALWTQSASMGCSAVSAKA